MKFLFSSLILFSVNISCAQLHRVAIIGGGTAGLAAAHAIHVCDSLAEIHVFEKNPIVGGNACRVAVENNGRQVFVDLGPQYFTEGAWDQYIQLLEGYGLYDESRFSRFPASFTISNRSKGSTIFCTPKDGKSREKFGQLLKFNRFYSGARKLYKRPDKYEELSVGEWLDQIRLEDAFKKEIITPFLSASLGVDHESIRAVSAKEIVKLFAFRSALKKNTFNVFHEGMAGMMQELALQLKQEGIIIHTSSEIISAELLESGATLTAADETTSTYDFVVFAVHPDAIYSMLTQNELFVPAFPILQELSYFQADIVLHRDSTLCAKNEPSFLNILVDDAHRVYTSTMDLGVIDSQYAGLYKSWLPHEKIAELKASGLFLAEHTFFHPMITAEFVESTKQLQEFEARMKSFGFAIAGGWTQGMETQETAVISGEKAAEAYLRFIQSSRLGE